VHDLAHFARSCGILCQGRGSAANSLVAYLLDITPIDPLSIGLVFERFLFAERATAPDIDLDFATALREEVIQYLYQKYGHEHAAMACTVVTFGARQAVRTAARVPIPVVVATISARPSVPQKRLRSSDRDRFRDKKRTRGRSSDRIGARIAIRLPDSEVVTSLFYAYMPSAPMCPLQFA
jgi:Bacterial DNA polymerase III alpha NTPase domain